MTPSANQAISPFDRHWLAETVRLSEGHGGPREDSEANRQARAAGGSFETRVLTRAERLAERDGLVGALEQWRQSAGVMLLALGLLAILLGGTLAGAALEGEQPVNVFWALGSLLGVHLLALLVWTVTLAGTGGGAVGRLWLWLVGRISRHGHGARLGPALWSLLQRAGLTRWGLGIVVHAFWLLALLSALATLLAMLSARRYGFAWETTLLTPEAFVTLTRAIGGLPSLLGFPLPDVDTVRASNLDQGAGVANEAARQAWAGWLLGSLVVYGIVPRALLLAACAWGWQRQLGALTLDATLPEYAILRDRLVPASTPLGVSDPAEPEGIAAHAERPHIAGQGAMLVAVELDERHPWPPALPKQVTDAGVADTRAQRQQLLERLTQSPPARLAIACDPMRSVDRGTLRLIGELARLAGAARVWLLTSPPDVFVDESRWAQWREALSELSIETTESAPMTWLEHGHD
ncbi:MAG: DUF2868 domain-containing protein [Halofilum sp. (in: g-proteobacteria)]